MFGCFKDPTYVLMRVLLCKIQCPSFFCFCKPSPHIYAASGSLKLEENTPPQVSSSSTTTIVDDNDDDDLYVDAHGAECVDGLLNEVREEDPALEEKEEACAVDEKQEEEILKSSLKKEVLDSPREKKKKKVQWVDLMGKELAEIREFESSEEDDVRYDGDQSCVCVIL
ncbi:hypothetical protein N665_1324s0013 [Sinapis alba]|nr:hypothetical protein N665_1324s0013 [Sinapis alba]